MNDFSVIVSRHHEIEADDFGVIAKFALFTDAENSALAMSQRTSYPIYVIDDRRGAPRSVLVCTAGVSEFAR